MILSIHTPSTNLLAERTDSDPYSRFENGFALDGLQENSPGAIWDTFTIRGVSLVIDCRWECLSVGTELNSKSTAQRAIDSLDAISVFGRRLHDQSSQSSRQDFRLLSIFHIFLQGIFHMDLNGGLIWNEFEFVWLHNSWLAESVVGHRRQLDCYHPTKW